MKNSLKNCYLKFQFKTFKNMAENFIEKIREIVVTNFSVKSLEKNSANCYSKNLEKIRQIAIQKFGETENSKEKWEKSTIFFFFVKF